MRIAQKLEGAEILLNHWTLISKERFDVAKRMKLFLLVFRHKSLRERLLLTEVSAVILKDAISGGFELLSSVVSVVRRVEGSTAFVYSLSSYGFFKEFISIAFVADNPDLTRNGLLLIDAAARMGFVEDYLLMIPHLPSVLTMSPLVQSAALSAIVVLSCYQETEQVFAENKIPELVSKMDLPANYEGYRKDYLEKWKTAPGVEAPGNVDV
jgi:hypothetical protein